MVIHLKFLNQEYILPLFLDFNNLCVFPDLLHPREWLDKNKSCLDAVSVKMDLMNETATILVEERERIKGWVNCCGGKAKQNGRRTEIYG